MKCYYTTFTGQDIKLNLKLTDKFYTFYIIVVQKNSSKNEISVTHLHIIIILFIQPKIIAMLLE